MSDRLQLVFSVLSLGLVATAGFLVLKATRPVDPTGNLAPLPPVDHPDTVDVWLADVDGRAELLFKPVLDSTERDGFNNRTLSRRLGEPDDTYRFFRLFVANFDAEGDFELEADYLRVQAGEGIESLDPEQVLGGDDGPISDGDRMVASALGLRAGPYRVPPRRAGSFLVAFRSSDLQPLGGAPEEFALVDGDSTLRLKRESIPRDELDRFFLDPREPLSAVLHARRPADTESGSPGGQ